MTGRKTAKPKRNYTTPPPVNYQVTTMAVGTLTKAFESGDGPQRDRPQDKNSYIRSLRARAKAYGEYNPVVLRPRVVSDRGNGKFWPLDGNGSNHWLEEQYGPDFSVPVYLAKGLTLAEENAIFQQIQKSKHVTRNEQFQNDREFNSESDAFEIERILGEKGYHTTNQVKDPWGMGATTSLFVKKRRGSEALADVLQVLSDTWKAEATVETDGYDGWKRTNGALVKALALTLGNSDYDRTMLLKALRTVTPAFMADGARGSGGESIVLPRIEALYKNYTGSQLVA